MSRIESPRDRLAAALRFRDPNLTADAESQRWAKLVRGDRNDPAAATLADVQIEGRRGSALGALMPRSADHFALAANELAKVERMLAAGQRLDRIIAAADPSRLSAILDRMYSTLDMLSSAEGDAIVSEVRSRAFDRMVTLHDATATATAAAEYVSTVAPKGAWARRFTEAQNGDPSLAARQAVYLADPERYATGVAHDTSLAGAMSRAATVSVESS